MLPRKSAVPAIAAGALLLALAGFFVRRPAAPLPFRAVWVQDRLGMRDVYALGSDLYLMGLDATRRRGRERPLLRAPGNYSRPMLTDDGRTVVFSDRRTGEAYALPWGGRKPRALGPGRALDTWTDPETKDIWVAIGDAADPHPRLHRRVQLVRLDDPSIRRDLDLDFAVNENNFQFHADGRFAGGDRAGAGCGYIDLETGAWTRTADGCWATMAPHGAPVVAVLRNGHRTMDLTALADRARTRIDVAAGTEPPGHEMFHPRWTNHRRFLALTGPYLEGTGHNRIGYGGAGVEVYLLEFGPDLAAVRATHRITRNAFADFLPDIWMAPAP